MQVCEGSAYKNGISVWYLDGEKTYAINSARAADGKIYTKIEDNIIRDKNSTKWRLIAAMFVAICAAFIILMCNLFSNKLLDPSISFSDVLFIYIVAMTVFVGYFVYILLYSINNESTLKYHSAMHIILNYYKVNKRLPKTLEEVVQGSLFVNTCTYNVVSSFLFLFVLVSAILVLCGSLALKAILCVLALFFTVKWMLEGKLAFFQNAIFEIPTFNEFEVVLTAFKRIEEIGNETQLTVCNATTKKEEKL